MTNPTNYNYCKANIIFWAFDFLKERATPEDVFRDSHMNAFGDSDENPLLDTGNPAWDLKNKGRVPEPFDQEDVKIIISAVLTEVDPQGDTRLESIHATERAVRKVLPDLYAYSDKKEISLDRDTIDALLVGFINYVGTRMCVDYAMYTKDLRKPNEYIYRKNNE
jgi:hypothetical protein